MILLIMATKTVKKVELFSMKKEKITKEDKVKVIYELRHKYSMKALVAYAQIPRSNDFIKKINRPNPNADF